SARAGSIDGACDRRKLKTLGKILSLNVLVNESSVEAVTCANAVDHFVVEKRRLINMQVAVPERCTIAAMLDHKHIGVSTQLVRRIVCIIGSCNRTDFTFIRQKDVDVAQQ